MDDKKAATPAEGTVAAPASSASGQSAAPAPKAGGKAKANKGKGRAPAVKGVRKPGKRRQSR